MASESWKRIYADLINKIVSMGYPEEFGKEIAKNLGSENTMRRMCAYLYSTDPGSPEEIVDEMLAIMSDRDRWRAKKETEYYNARYNEFLNSDFGEE